MTLQEILDRVQNVLYQGVDTESQDLDLLRHDLELEIIEKENNEKENDLPEWSALQRLPKKGVINNETK